MSTTPLQTAVPAVSGRRAILRTVRIAPAGLTAGVELPTGAKNDSSSRARSISEGARRPGSGKGETTWW